jgi:natural product precursor
MKLKELKLNDLSTKNLNNRQMNTLKGGGNCCTCSCFYAGQPGGSSSIDNRNANHDLGDGAYSPVGDNRYWYCSRDLEWKPGDGWPPFP